MRRYEYRARRHAREREIEDWRRRAGVAQPASHQPVQIEGVAVALSRALDSASFLALRGAAPRVLAWLWLRSQAAGRRTGDGGSRSF